MNNTSAAETPAPLSSPMRRVALAGEMRFAGRAVARELLRKGFLVRALCPDDTTAAALAEACAAPDLRLSAAELSEALEVRIGPLDDLGTLTALLEGCYGACLTSPVTLSGRLFRSGTFAADVTRFSHAAREQGAARLVIQSLLGICEKPASALFAEAYKAEEALHGADAVILRTGPLMGPGDGFLEDCVRRLRNSGLFMLMEGYGSTPLQPLHVDDFALSVARALLAAPQEIKPGTYNLGGPDQSSPLDLVDRVCVRIKKSVIKIHAPLFVLKLLSLGASSAFAERVNLLFEAFAGERSDLPLFLGRGVKPVTLDQAINAQVEAIERAEVPAFLSQLPKPGASEGGVNQTANAPAVSTPGNE